MQLRRYGLWKVYCTVILLISALFWIGYNDQIDYIYRPAFLTNVQGGSDELLDSTDNQNLVDAVANIQEWRFGNYCVWFDFTKAIQLPDEDSVTLCTHGTAGYSKFVFDHADYWDDQISLALLVDPAGFPALSTYSKLHRCTSALQRVSTHLVWSRQHGDCSPDFVVHGLSSQPPDPMPDDCTFQTHLALFKHDFRTPYPPNTLRNVARAGARTQGHLIADIENHFSRGAAEVIRAFKHTIQSGTTAVVVRRFEVDQQEEVPRDVPALRQLVDDGKAGEFHFKVFPAGHSVPFLQEFLNYSTTTGTVPRLTPVNYQGFRWEPQLVVHRTHPFHFEGIPIRYTDQQVLPYELCRRGINFAVASHVFSVHHGIKEKRSEKEAQAYYKSKNEGNLYKRKYKKYIEETYPDTKGLCKKS